MLQVLLALLILGVGGYLFYRGIKDSSDGKFIVGAIFGLIGIVWAAALAFEIGSAHIGIDSDIAQYEQVKTAVRAVRQGDPSYSGILLEALRWNQAIAVSRTRIDSAWFGLFYNRRIAALEPIEFPGSVK